MITIEIIIIAWCLHKNTCGTFVQAFFKKVKWTRFHYQNYCKLLWIILSMITRAGQITLPQQHFCVFFKINDWTYSQFEFNI